MKRLSDALFFLLSFEKFHKVVFCAGRMEEFQSMFVGRIFVFECIDFDYISRLRNITDRFDLSVDNGIFETQSDGTMDSKRKIQDCASYRQFDDIPLWCIQENTFLEDLDIELFFELFLIIKRFVVGDDIL